MISTFPWVFIFLTTCTLSGIHGQTISNYTNTTQISSPALEDLQTVYYEQTLDHFTCRPDSYTTFQQRYMVNYKYWGGTNSPIFVLLGGEQPIDYVVPMVGFLNDHAPQFNALIVYIEHRYYGNSVPFGSEEAFRNTSTLGYLTSAQALADYAELILDLKKKLSAENSPVIVIGGSYSGMLAAWFRLKYPHIALGALASSAPILYFDHTRPQDQYYSIVSKDFRDASIRCYETIKQAWPIIDEIASKEDGLSLLSKTFKTCNPIKTSDDLKDYLEHIFVTAAQYSFAQVREICEAIDYVPVGCDILGRIYAGVVAFEGEKSCYDINHNITGRSLAWHWQTCTEMIFGIGRPDNSTMFPVSPFNLEDIIEACHHRYGATVIPRPNWILTQFGGKDIKLTLENFGSNIIFSNGLRDPYSGGGVQQDISDSLLAINTEKGTHCMDILTSSYSDPPWLVLQRLREVTVIKKWIAEYKARQVMSGQGSALPSTKITQIFVILITFLFL